MSIARKLGVPLAGAILALSGCTTTYDGGVTTGQPYSNKSTTTGSSSSPGMQQTRDPAKASNCAKFDSIPQECERALGGY